MQSILKLQDKGGLIYSFACLVYPLASCKRSFRLSMEKGWQTRLLKKAFFCRDAHARIIRGL